jgi:predicted Zn finger-like uncharacterized protein
MSLITRCPACETLFKVVPDQLRISEGWVRCGQCDEIFDASLHLMQSPAAPSAPAAPLGGDAETSNATTDALASTSVLQPLDIDLDSAQLGSFDELPEEADPIALDDPALPVEAWDVPEPTAAALHMPMAEATLDEPEPSAAVHKASFLRDRTTRSDAPGPLMRATLVFLSLTLLLGLLGQVLIHERDRIVALESGLKPWLQVFCRPFNCTVSPLRWIDAIVIDSASFTKIQGDIFHLNLTLKNTAMTALAVPAVELTLTDALDQTVIRRVFLPHEFDGKPDTLAAGSEWSASLAVAVKASGTPDRVAGYRLLAFYP